jgi:hypothetical protein
MNPVDASTIALLQAGGIQPIPADSGMGPVYRPLAKGQSGGRLATPETLYDYWLNAVFDPDQALAVNPNILNEIHAHPDVSAAMLKRSMTVAQFEEVIGPNPQAPDKKLGEEIAAMTRRIWDAIPHRIRLYQEMAYYATLEGGIGHDWVWHRDATGLQRPVDHWMVHKSRFVYDRQGNLALRTRTTPVWGTYVAANEMNDDLIRASEVPRGRIVYHMFLSRPGMWEQPDLEGYQYFGVGLDIPLSYLVTFGFFAMRMWSKYMEKFGIPPYKFYYPQNIAMTPQLRAIAHSIRAESVIQLPRIAGGEKDGQYAVDPLEVPTAQFNWFQDTVKWITEKVYSLILFQADASGGENSQGGYSKEVSKHDTGPSVAYKFDAKNISDTINADLLPAIALQRFPNLPPEYMPVHSLQASEERDRTQEADVAEKAMKILPLVEDELYKRFGFTKPEPGEKTVGGEAPEQSPFDMGDQTPPLGAQGAPKPSKGVPGMGKQTQNEGAGPSGPVGQGKGVGNGSVTQKAPKQRTENRMETSGRK